MRARVQDALTTPVDPASFLIFRVGFGLLAAFAALRFVLYGWGDELLLQPRFLFSWIDGLPRPTAPWLYGLFGVQFLAGIGIALGWRVRSYLVLWLLSFGYIELLDKTLYLNHYVLFTLLGVLLLCAPVERIRFGREDRLPGWVLWMFRVQIASVYIWAGLTKLNADWLLQAEPLSTWLAARVDTPLIGSLLASKATAYAMSWGGMLYDLSIPFLLLMPKFRWTAFVLVCVFHISVWLLFPIGIFPWLMMLSATLLLPPSWPRRFFKQMPSFTSRETARWSTRQSFFWCMAVLIIVAFPARSYFMEGNASWTERGYRFSWRVMLNEKTGLVDYRIEEKDSSRVWRVLPGQILTPLQHKQMRTQPDMIRDFALYLEKEHASEGRDVVVYADAWASLNRRPSQRLIRPDVDLTLPMVELERLQWIVPLAERP